MKISDQIVKASSDLEAALRKAAETFETYTGDKLDDATLEDAAYGALSAAGDLDGSDDIDSAIGALQSIGE